MGHFGGSAEGEEACRAIDALCKAIEIRILLDTVIKVGCCSSALDVVADRFWLQPLRELVDKQSRVDCSLSLTSETGRVSLKSPNLPPQDNDPYEVRSCSH